MIDRLQELEARQEELKERLATVLPKSPDIHPNIAGIYRRKMARLAEALEKPQESLGRAGRASAIALEASHHSGLTFHCHTCSPVSDWLNVAIVPQL